MNGKVLETIKPMRTRLRDSAPRSTASSISNRLQLDSKQSPSSINV